jgi:flagellar FliL protein
MVTKPVPKPALRPVATIAEPPAPVKKKKRKLLPIIGVIFVLALLASAGSWYFLYGPGSAQHAAEKAANQPPKPPVFITLEPFTVNLQGGDHFLQLGVVLQVSNDETSDTVKAYLPQIRNRLLLLLSSKSPADLESIEAKRKLADEILAETRLPLAESVRPDIQGVLFSSMVIQ